MSDLFERTWPLESAKATVVIVHGMAEHSGRYDYVAAALNDAGYAVVAPDMRGHGRSPGFPADMGMDVQRIVDDVAEVCERVRTTSPKTFLVGHSLGTLFSIAAAVGVEAGTLAGLVLSGVALEPGDAVVKALGEANPALPPETISRDPEIVKAYIDDVLVWKDISPSVMTIALAATQKAKEAVKQIRVPTLFLHGTADQLCSIRGAHEAYAEMVIADRTVKAYNGLYHEVFNEPERDTVIADLVAWLDAH